jgi:hypothetical protein
MTKIMKLVTYAPVDAAERVRDVMGKAGAGKIGNYSHCTFSMRGMGRFKPEKGADPSIGEVGELEAVEEERIETVCEYERLKDVINAIKSVHPYEEVPIDVYPIELVE